MISHRFPFWSVLLLALVPSLAAADEVSLVKWAKQRVQQGLVQPITQNEHSSFSRSRPRPHQRRVRILEAKLLHDKNGKGFVPFAVDIRYDEDWQSDIAGCVYRGSGELFVKVGDSYRSASFYTGEDAEPVADVCEVAPES